jgi:hypothetical protein
VADGYALTQARLAWASLHERPLGGGKLLGMGEWDMHDAGAAPVVDEKDRLHVDIIAIAPPDIRLAGPEEFPPVGAEVAARVLGYAGDQFRLSLQPARGRERDVPRPDRNRRRDGGLLGAFGETTSENASRRCPRRDQREFS